MWKKRLRISSELALIMLEVLVVLHYRTGLRIVSHVLDEEFSVRNSHPRGFVEVDNFAHILWNLLLEELLPLSLSFFKFIFYRHLLEFFPILVLNFRKHVEQLIWVLLHIKQEMVPLLQPLSWSVPFLHNSGYLVSVDEFVEEVVTSGEDTGFVLLLLLLDHPVQLLHFAWSNELWLVMRFEVDAGEVKVWAVGVEVYHFEAFDHFGSLMPVFLLVLEHPGVWAFFFEDGAWAESVLLCTSHVWDVPPFHDRSLDPLQWGLLWNPDLSLLKNRFCFYGSLLWHVADSSGSDYLLKGFLLPLKGSALQLVELDFSNRVEGNSCVM